MGDGFSDFPRLTWSAERDLREERLGWDAHGIAERLADRIAARRDDRAGGDDVEADVARAELLLAPGEGCTR